MNAAVVGIVAAPSTLLLVARQVDLSVGSAVGFAGTTLTVVAESRYGLAVAVLAGIGAAIGIAAINAVAITKLRVNSLIATLGTLAAFRGAAKLIGGGRSIRLDGFRLPGPEPLHHPRHRRGASPSPYSSCWPLRCSSAF